MKMVTVDQMRELDQRTIKECGVPGSVLMERAGRGAADHIIDFVENVHQRHARRFVILAGGGNNGGDGYVVAEELFSRTGKEVIIFAICHPDKMGEDAAGHARRVCKKIDTQIREKLLPSDFKQGDIIIDALIGIGVSGKPRLAYEQWIELVNQQRLPVVSLDVPSGMNGDNGTAAGACIVADMTITIGLPKVGLASNEAMNRCGRLRLVEIGIPDTYAEGMQTVAEMFFANDAAKLLTCVPMNFHKKNRGFVTVIGGSKDYYGAPFLAAVSALRAGAGLVRVAIPESVSYMPGLLPSALIMNRVTANKDGYLCPSSFGELRQQIEQSDVLVVGPGIGRHPDIAAFTGMIFEQASIPVVIDADALHLIAEYPDKCPLRENHILTPHPGEMKKLVEAFCPESRQKDRVEQATELAGKTSATIVLKGNKTVIASPDGRIIVNSSGSPALATAGSGDCLTGVIAALVVANSNIFAATAAAVFIHGLAGELSPFGTRGLIADDLPNYIPQAIRYISPLG